MASVAAIFNCIRKKKIMGKLRANKKLLATGIVLLVIMAMALSKKNAINAQKKQDNVVLLNKADITGVKRARFDDIIYFTGDLAPKEQTIISSEVDARVIKVLVDEGQIVKAGQELALLDTLDLAQAVTQQEALVAAARAKYELDQQKLDKQQQLFKQGFISRIAYDELQTNYQASLQNFKAQEALLIRSKKQLADTHIKAPFAGVIFQKSVQNGQLALKNTKLFSLANLSSLEIKAAIPSDAINRIKLNQQVVFKVETDNRAYDGQISRINQVAQSGTRSYMVYIDFNNQSYGLKAGQFVKGEIILQSLPNQLIMSCDSLRDGNEGKYVLILENGKILQKKIQLIMSNQQSNQCAISGLAGNEDVLAGNVLTVKPGDSAKIVD